MDLSRVDGYPPREGGAPPTELQRELGRSAARALSIVASFVTGVTAFVLFYAAAALLGAGESTRFLVAFFGLTVVLTCLYAVYAALLPFMCRDVDEGEPLAALLVAVLLLPLILPPAILVALWMLLTRRYRPVRKLRWYLHELWGGRTRGSQV